MGYRPISAQRRPGHAPRRHSVPDMLLALAAQRSTKAGARTPATRVTSKLGPPYRCGRSTKAGARTPATLVRSGTRGLSADQRSTKAGARTPATLRPGHAARARRSALNEGRGTHPGDTCVRAGIGHWTRLAQRRPGHAPRRHTRAGRRSGRAGAPLNEGRGTHPGDTSDAESRGAGARRPLNEGRGTHPGDTMDEGWNAAESVHAQRRPGHAPRRHAMTAGRS